MDDWIDEDGFVPRYNVAPRSKSAVIRRQNRFDDRGVQDADKHHAVMQTMKVCYLLTCIYTIESNLSWLEYQWGVVPHWSKYEDKSMNTINAKAEHLVEGGGMWASIKGKKRCAVPCQGYACYRLCIQNI